MNLNENIIWLDGYMKGGVDALSDSNVSFNALLLKLSRENFIRDYLEFINNNDDSEMLMHEHPMLKMKNCIEVSNWSEIVIANFENLLGELLESRVRLLNQFLEMLEMIVTESFYQEVYLSRGEMGSWEGDYLFFRGRDDEYLVISFLFGKKAD